MLNLQTVLGQDSCANWRLYYKNHRCHCCQTFWEDKRRVVNLLHFLSSGLRSRYDISSFHPGEKSFYTQKEEKLRILKLICLNCLLFDGPYLNSSLKTYPLEEAPFTFFIFSGALKEVKMKKK